MGIAMDMPYQNKTNEKQLTGFVSIVKHLDWIETMIYLHYNPKKKDERTSSNAAFSFTASIHVILIFIFHEINF